MSAPRDDRAESLISAYEAFFARRRFPGKSPVILAQAAREKVRAEGRNPDLSDDCERFIVEANLTVHESGTSDADLAVLQGLLDLMGGNAGTPPAWVNDALSKVDWVHLYAFKDPRFDAFWMRAGELGLEPQPAELLQHVEVLDEMLEHCVLNDEACRRIWRERIAAKPVDEHWWRVEPLVRPDADVETQRYFCDLLADDIQLESKEREAALEKPDKFIQVFRGTVGIHKSHPAAARLSVRQWLNPEATWDSLDQLSGNALVALIKNWAQRIAKLSEYSADPTNMIEAVRDYGPLLRQLVVRGQESLKVLAREFLIDPPRDDAQVEDWRAAVVDLLNLVTAWWMRLQAPRPSPPDTGAWLEVYSKLEPELFESIASVAADEPEFVPQIERWIDILVGARRPGLTNPAAKISDPTLIGWVRAGRWDVIERQLPKLAGKHERIDQTRATLKSAVAAEARGSKGKECERFAIGLLARPSAEIDDFLIELAVAVAMGNEDEPEEVLSTPEKAQLNAFGTGRHHRAIGRDEIVALARRLSASPEILGALVGYWQSLPAQQTVRITLPPELGSQIRRLKNDSKSLEFLGGVPLYLEELLYATGDARMKPRAWNSLALWHLGAGHGIEEFFKDVTRSDGDDREPDRPPLGEIPADLVQQWMSEMLSEVEDEAAPRIVDALLGQLARIVSVARNHESLPWYRLHESWKRFGKDGPYPETWGLEGLAFHFCPDQRLPILETIVERLRPLTERNQEAWNLFASLATLLADHPAYPKLVTADLRTSLIEDAKKLLMDLRTKAPTASASNEPTNALYVALGVLCTFKDFSAGIRQLLMIFREIPFESIPASLSTHEGAQGKKWFAIPHLISLLIQSSPSDQRDDVRFTIADYLQDRLKPRKEGSSRAPAGEHRDMIEPDPVVREAYVEALADLRTDRGGRLHRLLGKVALSDPSGAVKDAARRCSARAKKSGKEMTQGSVGRFILNSWWWIRRGTVLRFGPQFVDEGLSKITRALETTRLRGNDSLN